MLIKMRWNVRDWSVEQIEEIKKFKSLQSCGECGFFLSRIDYPNHEIDPLFDGQCVFLKEPINISHKTCGVWCKKKEIQICKNCKNWEKLPDHLQFKKEDFESQGDVMKYLGYCEKSRYKNNTYRKKTWDVSHCSVIGGYEPIN